MPFGGLLTVGIISAAGAIGGSAIQAGAAGKAGSQAQLAAMLAKAGIDKATADAIAAGYYGLGEGQKQLDTGLTNGTQQVRDSLNDTYGQLDMHLNAAHDAIYGARDEANAKLDPYAQGGRKAFDTLTNLATGEWTKPFNAEQLQGDPGFQFRLQQGAQALDRSAAAKGSVLGGGQMKAMAKYSQGLASDEYQNAFKRVLDQRKSIFDSLNGVAGYGERATTAQAQHDMTAGGHFADITNDVGKTKGLFTHASGDTIANMDFQTGVNKANMQLGGMQWIGQEGLQGAEAAGQALTGGANAQAGATMASGNAWAQGLNNAGSSLSNLLLLKTIMGGGNPGTVGGTLGEVPAGVDPLAGVFKP